MATSPSRQQTSFLRRLAATCYDRRGFVVIAWVVAFAALFALNSTVGGEFRTQFALPGSESQDAIDILNSSGFNDRTGTEGQIVLMSENGIDTPEIREKLDKALADIVAQVPGTSTSSPFSEQGAGQVAPGGQIAYAQIFFSDRSSEEYLANAKVIEEIVDRDLQLEGVTVELGGDIFADFEMPASELIGVLCAIVILLVAFGSLLAMGLPIIAALFGVGSGFALVGLITNSIDMPDFTTQVAAMIGLGVGIDYALFIVTRFRQGLHAGMEPRDAVIQAVDTAGRAVIFAGITVVISLLGMVFMGMDMMRGLAIGSSVTVLMTMFASVTLVPAIMAFAGHNIDRFGIPGRKIRTEADDGNSFWHRWSHALQRNPWPFALGGLALLIILALPVFSLRLGFSEAGNRPESDTTRRAYDILSDGFGPGSNGTMLGAARISSADDLAALGKIADAIRDTPGVAFVTPPIPNADNTAAIMQIIPSTAPQDAETTDLVHTLRDDVVPAAAAGSNVQLKIGGITPSSSDFSDFTAHRLPYFFAAVLTLSFILLLAVFRSVLVPLKAIIMNLLSIGAAYGVLVAIFQWGWGMQLVGVDKEGPVEAWLPMMLFAIVFGLSMDYEVFLLSRIREEYDRTRNNATAVADGLAATARVISAAALIMVCVFGSFVLGPERALKMAGLGLAVAVAVDATIIRLILVPATMELLGDLNWWMPKWLDRLLPALHVEAPPAPKAVEPATGRTSRA